jgi:hypothetical protein
MSLKLSQLIHYRQAKLRINAGVKNEGILHYVIENKRIKNVRKRPLHYVDEKKGGYSRLSTMLMKINDVIGKAVMSDERQSPRSGVRSPKSPRQEQ